MSADKSNVLSALFLLVFLLTMKVTFVKKNYDVFL